MKKVLVLAAVFALAAPAFAQVTQPAPAMPSAKPAAGGSAFTKIDTDASGSLSLGEIKLMDTTVTQADFNKYDADHNKSISKAEFTKWQTAKASMTAPAPKPPVSAAPGSIPDNSAPTATPPDSSAPGSTAPSAPTPG